MKSKSRIESAVRAITQEINDRPLNGKLDTPEALLAFQILDTLRWVLGAHSVSAPESKVQNLMDRLCEKSQKV